MYVKRIQSNDILDGLHLAWEVFAQDVAPTYPPQGVEEFQQFIKYDHMFPKAQRGEIVFFYAVEGEELCGMSAIRTDGHVSLLFVRKEWQRKGAARRLFHAMQQYCVIERRIATMTVSATPNAVAAYEHLGFRATSAEQIENGIRFVPMTYMIKDANLIAGGGKIKNPKRMSFYLVIFLLIFFGMSFIGSRFASYLVEKNDGMTLEEFLESEAREEEGKENESQSQSGSESGESAESAGIESVPCYIAEDIIYSIEEEVYTYYSDGANGEYPMEFEVRYPKIVGVEGEHIAKINQNLKECAMSTVEVLYLNPSQATKEAMLQLETPVLASQVTYQVTYATNEFISVAFNDLYCAGNSQIGYVDLRTRNISLVDGTIYEVKDIVNLADEFMSDWLVRMKKEAPGVSVLKELRTSEFYRILNGEILEGNYSDAFFVDAEGIQIGITYHHTNESTSSNGWITAPFTLEEISVYKTESEFWTLVD